MKKKRNALWFFNKLWDYYLSFYERPGISTSGYVFLGNKVIKEESMLPALRKLWAQHLRARRRDLWLREKATIQKNYIHTNIPVDKCVWKLKFKRLCSLEKLIAKSHAVFGIKECKEGIFQLTSL